MPETLYVRTDATTEIGLGHFMRCLALAQAWRNAVGDVSFIGSYDPQSISRLLNADIAHIDLNETPGSAADLSRTCNSIPKGSAIVLDGYGFDFDYQQALAEHGTLLVIDDCGHLPAYAGALLLNPNPAAKQIDYKQAPSNRLLGPDYMLLADSFADGSEARIFTESARQLVVTMGGADAQNVGAQIGLTLGALSAEQHIRVIVGPLNDNPAAVERMLESATNVEVCIAPVDMAAVLQQADLAVSAAGTTAVQLARLGVPSVLIAVAENQYELGASLDAAGAAVYLGPWPATTPDDVASTVAALANDPERLTRMSEAGRSNIDGRGASRVCEAFAALT